MPTVVAASRLRSGTPVYLSKDGCWVKHLHEAWAAEDTEALKELEAHAAAAVQRNEVTAAYAFKVRVENGRPVPISAREEIRAAHARAA